MIVNSVSTDLNLSRNPCALGLSKAAGPQLQKLCQEWIQTNGNLAQYDFAITKSGKLQCQFVFHAACGDYNGATTEKVSPFPFPQSGLSVSNAHVCGQVLKTWRIISPFFSDELFGTLGKRKKGWKGESYV